jgi:hypothetical protein
MAGYSKTPLVKKLGFKENSRAAIRNSPEGFSQTLGALPKGAAVVPRARGRFDLVLLFARREAKLKADFAKWVVRLNPAAMLWVAWPKKTAKVPTDLDFDVVQKIGLAAGLVDNKICAVDETWSGLRFVRRVRDR